MATMMTRVNGQRVTMDTRYHSAGAMTTLLGMVEQTPNVPIYEVFCHVKGGSETVGFMRSYDAAEEYADALGGGHDFAKVV